MKKAICIHAFLVFFFCVRAQQKPWVTDKEQLFTTEEINRIAAMLQDYHKTSGNLIVVCTDSLDVSTNKYKDSLINLYTGNMPVKPYALFLLVSRKNSTIQMDSNDLPTGHNEHGKDNTGNGHTVDNRNPNSAKPDSAELAKKAKDGLDTFLKIISYGVPALKEKKREEGVTIICKKAMEFLDGLPKKELNK